MTEVTLEAVKARQTELAEMISALEHRAAQSRILTLPETDIELKPGEHYAGTVLNDDGSVKHHLILLAEVPTDRLAWSDAKAWAESIGGELPTRQEQALLFANCKSQFESAWYWSGQEYETDASYAWYCDFYYGYQGSSRKSYGGAARAVRRLIP